MEGLARGALFPSPGLRQAGQGPSTIHRMEGTGIRALLGSLSSKSGQGRGEEERLGSLCLSTWSNKPSEKDGPFPGIWNGWAGSRCFMATLYQKRQGQGQCSGLTLQGPGHSKMYHPHSVSMETGSQVSLRPRSLVVKNAGSEARMSSNRGCATCNLGSWTSHLTSLGLSVSPSVKCAMIIVLSLTGWL